MDGIVHVVAKSRTQLEQLSLFTREKEYIFSQIGQESQGNLFLGQIQKPITGELIETIEFNFSTRVTLGKRKGFQKCTFPSS